MKMSEEALLSRVSLGVRGGPTGSNCRQVRFGGLDSVEAAPQLLDSSGNPEKLGSWGVETRN